MAFCSSRLSIINPPTQRQANPAPGLPPLSITGVNSAKFPPLTPYFRALYQFVVSVFQRTRPRTRTAAAGCPAQAARRPRTEAAARDARRGAQRPRTEAAAGRGACRAAGSRGGQRGRVPGGGFACRGRLAASHGAITPLPPPPRSLSAARPPPLSAARPPPLSAARPAFSSARRRLFHALCAPRPATPEAIPRRALLSSHSAPPEPRHARSHPAAAVLPRAPRARPRAVRPTPPYSPRLASRRPTLPGALMPPAVRPSPPHDVSLMSPCCLLVVSFLLALLMR